MNCFDKMLYVLSWKNTDVDALFSNDVDDVHVVEQFASNAYSD